MTPSELTSLLHREIPLTRALDLAVETAEIGRIRVSGPLEANRNLHGTVFAGSIYCFATLAGWTLVHNLCQRHQLLAAVVLSRADIRYIQPVRQNPVAESWLPSTEEVERFLYGLRTKNRARINIPASLTSGGELAVSFSGEFVASLGQHQ